MFLFTKGRWFMEYRIVQLPAGIQMNDSVYRQFAKLSPADAKAYFRWFLEQIPVRVEILERVVRATPGFESWTADYTVASLEPLGEWFCRHVSVRKRTPDEVARLREEHPAWVRDSVRDWDLTDVTHSLCIDVGMYFGKVLLKNVPGLKWVVGSKKSTLDANQPVLSGFGKVDCNPVWIISVVASRVAEGKDGPRALRELYDTWSSLRPAPALSEDQSQ